MEQQASSVKRFMVLREGRQIGPLDAAELRGRAREGTISPLDSVSVVGSDKWVLGYQVKGLFPAWLAAEIKVRTAKGEGIDDLLRQAGGTSPMGPSPAATDTNEVAIAPLEDSGWYWLDESRRFGPVDLGVIRSMLESGALPEDCQVSRSEGGPWLYPSLYPELKPAVHASENGRGRPSRTHRNDRNAPPSSMRVAGVVAVIASVVFGIAIIPIMLLETGRLPSDAVDVLAGDARGARSARSQPGQHDGSSTQQIIAQRRARQAAREEATRRLEADPQASFDGFIAVFETRIATALESQDPDRHFSDYVRASIFMKSDVEAGRAPGVWVAQVHLALPGRESQGYYRSGETHRWWRRLDFFTADGRWHVASAYSFIDFPNEIVPEADLADAAELIADIVQR